MDTNTPYEHLIAAKLEQVPVPDMADSIWSAIEMQLDADVDVPDKKTTPKPKGKGWYGFAAVPAAVALLWWYTSHTNHPPQNTSPQQPFSVPAITPPATDSHTRIDNTKKKIAPLLPMPAKKAPLLPEEKPDSVMGKDSVAERIFPLLKMEPPHQPPTKPAIPVVDSVMAPPPVKKIKGVKGISSEDYKISAQKDSARKSE